MSIMSILLKKVIFLVYNKYSSFSFDSILEFYSTHYNIYNISELQICQKKKSKSMLIKLATIVIVNYW
jgi:hypothetical protein